MARDVVQFHQGKQCRKRERERSLWVGCEIERVPREPQTPSLQFRNDSVSVAIPSSSIFNELGTLPLKM